MAPKFEGQRPRNYRQMPPMSSFDNPDFRLYMEEKFNLVHEKIDNLKENVDGVDLSVKELTHIVDTMQVQERQHYIACPNTAELKTLSTQVQEFKFFKKHKNTFAISYAVMFLGLLMAIYEGSVKYGEVMGFIKKQATEQAVIEKEVDGNTTGRLQNNIKIDKGRSELYKHESQQAQ